ncbi:MAG: AraC family transcriptional regulator [Kiritimatiellae bacterium]|nr:AraC family transcriptional regulator [Kiritimatiellia bacterium]
MPCQEKVRIGTQIHPAPVPIGGRAVRARGGPSLPRLRGTDLPLGEIARQCGFCHAQHLSNLFRRDTGLSPRAWRMQNH